MKRTSFFVVLNIIFFVIFNTWASQLPEVSTKTLIKYPYKGNGSNQIFGGIIYDHWNEVNGNRDTIEYNRRSYQQILQELNNAFLYFIDPYMITERRGFNKQIRDAIKRNEDAYRTAVISINNILNYDFDTDAIVNPLERACVELKHLKENNICGIIKTYTKKVFSVRSEHEHEDHQINNISSRSMEILYTKFQIYESILEQLYQQERPSNGQGVLVSNLKKAISQLRGTLIVMVFISAFSLIFLVNKTYNFI